MSCQVWDKDGNIHHITIEDFEASVPAGIYTVADPKDAQPQKVKAPRKSKAVTDENQD